MIHEHKFITYDDRYSKPYLLQINQKDVKPYKPLLKKRFEKLEEAIIARDNFLNNYQDKRYKGVTYSKSNQLWKSQISIKGKTLYIGTHKTQEEAKEYRNQVLKKLMN